MDVRCLRGARRTGGKRLFGRPGRAAPFRPGRDLRAGPRRAAGALDDLAPGRAGTRAARRARGAAAAAIVIPGRRGIDTHRCELVCAALRQCERLWLWIPGLAPWAAPE